MRRGSKRCNKRGLSKWQNLPLKDEHEPTGEVTDDEIEHCRQDVRCTIALLNAWKQEFDKHSDFDLKPWDAYSHASIAKACLNAMGIVQAGVNLLPNRPQEAKERLEGAIEEAAKAVTEGRDAIQDLRSSTIEANDLAAALKTLAGEFAAGESNENAPVFGVEVEGTPRDLHPILRDDIFRIAGGALRNVFRHARASRIEVNIRYGAERFRVRIRDDGRGIDPQIVTDKGLSGHWGLRGMHERAKQVGGSLEVWSKRDAGTEIELAIPAAIAYGKTNAGRRLWIFRRKTDGTNEEQS